MKTINKFIIALLVLMIPLCVLSAASNDKFDLGWELNATSIKYSTSSFGPVIKNTILEGNSRGYYFYSMEEETAEQIKAIWNQGEDAFRTWGQEYKTYYNDEGTNLGMIMTSRKYNVYPQIKSSVVSAAGTGMAHMYYMLRSYLIPLSNVINPSDEPLFLPKVIGGDEYRPELSSRPAQNIIYQISAIVGNFYNYKRVDGSYDGWITTYRYRNEDILTGFMASRLAETLDAVELSLSDGSTLNMHDVLRMEMDELAAAGLTMEDVVAAAGDFLSEFHDFLTMLIAIDYEEPDSGKDDYIFNYETGKPYFTADEAMADFGFSF